MKSARKMLSVKVVIQQSGRFFCEPGQAAVEARPKPATPAEQIVSASNGATTANPCTTPGAGLAGTIFPHSMTYIH